MNGFGGDFRPIARLEPRGVIVSAETEGDEIANARLIAAAPDLLEALRAVRRNCSTLGMDKAVWDEVDAAIAKAEGR